MLKKGRPGTLLIFAIFLLATSILPYRLDAQPRTIGAGISYSGLSVCYEHMLKDNTFMELSIKSECAELSAGRSDDAGISASVVWNFIIREWQTDDSSTINLFAGPGVITGYGRDFSTEDGLILGLKGRLGVECLFKRNVAISASISPILGAHIIYDTAATSMKYYKNGLRYSLVPELGIKYRF